VTSKWDYIGESEERKGAGWRNDWGGFALACRIWDMRMQIGGRAASEVAMGWDLHWRVAYGTCGCKSGEGLVRV